MSNWKKFTIFGASALLLAACGNGGSEEGSEEGSDTSGGDESDFSIAMVTDTGGVDDRSFNQSSWEGMQDWADEHGFGEDSIAYYQSDSESDYIPHLNSATNDGYDVIYGIGYLHLDPITTIAEQNPDNWYGIVDEQADLPNVVSLTFRDHENSFLAGMAAALTTETDQVGFIGGVEGPVIDRFQTGFTAGVEHVNPDIDPDIQYANSFNDAAAGQQAAAAMYSSGVDVIFHAAGAVGNGVFQEAINRMESGAENDLWVIGVDRDQSAEGEYDDGNLTLGSTVKNVGAAVGQSATDAMEGNFQGGETIAYGLDDNGIDFVNPDNNISEDDWAQIEDAKQQIIDGEIEVPEFTYTETEDE